MRKITISLVLMTLVLGFVFAAETKTDNLAVKLTVTPALDIYFTGSEITNNNDPITGITDISMESKNTGTVTNSTELYVTVRTNYLKDDLTYKVYGTALTRYTQDNDESPLVYGKEKINLMLGLDSDFENTKQTFDEVVENDNQEGDSFLTLSEPENIPTGMRTFSRKLKAQADVTGAVQGKYIAYLVAEVVAK